MGLRRWQIVLVTLLVTGYSGYYLCRSNLSVVLPLLVRELADKGIPPVEAKIRFGTIASLGVLAYALGKFIAGPLADRLGGRRMFLTGMLGSVLCTIALAFSGSFPLFTATWVANRAVQSSGWAGMVKIVSRWFPASSYGFVMGIISLSYLFGDAAARRFMGILIQHGLGWRSVFFVTAAVLLALFVVSFGFVKNAPGDVGLEEPPGEVQTEAEPALLRSVLRGGAIWVVCALSVGLTLIRETFNLWIPTYFTEAAGMSSAAAAANSAYFSFFGGVSVLVAGYVSDRLGKGARALFIFTGLLLTALALGALGAGTSRPVLWTGLIAFFVIGPYSYLSGAIALDFGGKRGSATVSGLIDGSGYLGGVLAGDSMARLSAAWGWHGAFYALAALSALLTAPAAWFWWVQRKIKANDAGGDADLTAARPLPAGR